MLPWTLALRAVVVAEAREGVAPQGGEEERARSPRPEQPVAGDGADGVSVRLPEELVALIVMDGQAYWEYAYLQLDDEKAATDLVDDVFAELAAHWAVVLRAESVGRFCWAVLKTAVERALRERGRPTSFACAAAFTAAMGDARGGLEALESSLGLFTAIAQLPDRQHDVVVLTYVLGYSVRRAAQLMGITSAGVHSLRRDARRKLAAALGMDALEAEEAEKP